MPELAWARGNDDQPATVFGQRDLLEDETGVSPGDED